MHRIIEVLGQVRGKDYCFLHLAPHLLDETFEPFVSCRRIEARQRVDVVLYGFGRERRGVP